MNGSTPSSPASESKSQETSDPNTSQPSEDPIPKRTDQEKYKKNLLDLGLAHRSMMMDKILRQNKIVRDTVKGITSEGGGDSEGDEDMSISVGNEIHYHVENQGSPDTPVQPTSPPTAPPKSNSLLPWILAGVTGLAGAGLGAGLSGLGRGDHTVDTDTDTRTEATPGFGDPETIEE